MTSHIGYSDEQMSQRLNSFIARNRSKKALQTNQHYQDLLQLHKEAKKKLKRLGENRALIWHEIQVIRDQAYQAELWKLNEKEDTNESSSMCLKRQKQKTGF